ncbi:ImcF-related family protein [Pseudomonas sp. S2_C03]
MQFRHSVVIGVLMGVLLLATLALDVWIWRQPESLGITAGSAVQMLWLALLSASFLVVLFLGGYRLLGRQMGQADYRRLQADDVREPLDPQVANDARAARIREEIKTYLQENHGFFWRYKARLLLVVGEDAQVEAIAPGLKDKCWLAGHDTLLIWGGSTQNPFDESRFAPWSGLSRWRDLDGVVWALNSAQSTDGEAMDTGVRHLQALARRLRWHLPLHLWQICTSTWPQDKRATQTVGCLLPRSVTPQDVEQQLEQLVQPLRAYGLGQMNECNGHDFLLRLSVDLRSEGIARWRKALAPLLRLFARGVPLRGLWFSLPLPVPEKSDGHFWHATAPWGGVLDDRHAEQRRLGWGVMRTARTLALGLMLLAGAGVLLSFAANRVHVGQVNTALTTLQQGGSVDDQVFALHELTRELGQLLARAEHGAPWYLGFGLTQNERLLAAAWPSYVEANNRLMRDPVATELARQLQALIKLPADSPERVKRAAVAHAQLKAYLMLAQPAKTDSAFLARTLTEALPQRADISPGVWQGVAPNLWQFYAEQLAAHPQWRVEKDVRLVTQARQVLLGQLGQRNAQASLYQKVLDDSANQYPALGLQQMVAGTDANALFATPHTVPGVFTRQAWEGQVRQAIDAIAEARREEIDWVLSDQPGQIAAELSPEQLRQQLTDRYFEDYADAWLDFLNSLHGQPVGSLGEVIDQLTLMSDVRQSPLIALMSTLSWQGQAGRRGQALGDTLVKSAQKLMGQDAAIDLPESTGPLENSFGPLLALLDKDGDSERLSLQALLNRVTRVRLKLQQISNAANPQAMTQALAQTVFQGQQIDLTDTQAYASLVAASLGAEWDNVGQTLFVQPLEQAWQRVLQPAAAGLNSQWQRAIVNDWQQSFAGRYPFANTANDASLPMLGQMVRADSGRIEQFLQQQLGGVLRKEGSRWVDDSRHSQGLRFNPQFLTAINQLSHLADVLYTDGGMGMSFELRGKPVRDVVQTMFILNGEKHHYFNQKESWQRFGWPGFTSHPGTRLLWTSVRASERLFADNEGTWGLIRLLEKARVTPLNDSASHYRLQVRAPDGLDLTWDLRTELGAGPLALLKLRDFKLPRQIFLVENETTMAQNKRRY